MNRVLDVVALRSFVAVADCGGFHRAAAALHVSQPTVSAHVRRLEGVCGQPLMQRVGRTSRTTPAGDALLAHARRLLAVHDEALQALTTDRPDELVVGSTEHAADRLLPELTPDALGTGRVRFRLDRGARLREALDRGELDLALLLGRAQDERSHDAGVLELHWFAAPGWVRPAGEPLPLVALDDPCALRERALETLARQDQPVVVACEAAYLAGVLAAARAGLGVTLLATMGRVPEGLERRDELPAVDPVPMSLRTRRGLPPAVVERATGSLAGVLAGQRAPA